jgi:hypothetical protein
MARKSKMRNDRESKKYNPKRERTASFIDITMNMPSIKFCPYMSAQYQGKTAKRQQNIRGITEGMSGRNY